MQIRKSRQKDIAIAYIVPVSLAIKHKKHTFYDVLAKHLNIFQILSFFFSKL